MKNTNTLVKKERTSTMTWDSEGFEREIEELRFHVEKLQYYKEAILRPVRKLDSKRKGKISLKHTRFHVKHIHPSTR